MGIKTQMDQALNGTKSDIVLHNKREKCKKRNEDFNREVTKIWNIRKAVSINTVTTCMQELQKR